MLTLNYASEELKNEVKLRRVYNLIRKVTLIFVLVALFLAIIFYSTRLILQNSFNRIVDETTLLTKNSQGYNEKIKIINEKISIVMEIQKSYDNYTTFLDKLGELTTNNIHFTNLKLNLVGQKISLDGRADSRNALTQFKQTLENSKLFTNLKFPIKNISEKKDINFNFEADIN